uniref:RING-type domain-containing protein n=1 Tax=Amphimedon queenslandica TaxID=400682 RepID=A0A1X7US26_AMPQE
MSLSVLDDVKNYVEQSLKTGSPQQVQRCKKWMMEHMSEVTAGINVEELHPKEKGDFVLSKDPKSLHHIEDIISGTTALKQCRVKKIDRIISKAASFSLSMEAPDSCLLCVPLSSLRCSLVPVATKPFSSSPGLRLKLEEQLTCPVCLNHYTNPKILPCHHSFCQHCLEGFTLDKKNKTFYFSCPTCHHRTELPEEGVGAFSVAFHLHNLKEMYSLMKKTADLSNPQEATCSDHGKPLELFCETCDAVICSHCLARNHKHHEYDLIADSYTQHCQKLTECLSPVEGKKEALKKVLSALAEREGEIRERGEGVLEEIHEMVEEMIVVLRQSERKLTEQAKRVTDNKLKVLSQQIKSAEMSLSVLEDVEDYVEQSLKTGSPEQVLRCKKQMMERMSEVTAGINVEELHPKEKGDFVLSKDPKSLHHIGDIISGTTALKQCRVKKIDRIAPAGKAVTFSLSMETPDSCLLCVPLSSLRCSLVPVGKGDQPIQTTVTITSTDPGVYRIQCNPSIRGAHTVKVQVYDVYLEDTSLVIPFNPYLDNITRVRTITELNCPLGVAVSDDNHVIITENWGHCVTILDREGKKVKSLGGKGGICNVKFSYPRGVAITPDKFILVSDNHRIQKISMDGYRKASVGKKGSGPLKFNNPHGIAISPITGQAFIADRGNQCIQVLNPDLTFSHSFGSQGSANGRFQSPCAIAIDSQGLVYVADYDNHCIQKFSPDGKFVGQFGTDGSGPGQLFWPIGITIDTAATGLVYVSDYVNKCLSVFTSDGVLVSKFGSKGSNIDQFSVPWGLAFDKNGVLLKPIGVIYQSLQYLQYDTPLSGREYLSKRENNCSLDEALEEDIFLYYLCITPDTE